MTDISLTRRLQIAYQTVDHVDQLRVPYVFGGGHNKEFAASGPLDAPLLKPWGYDCSSFASKVLHNAGFLAVPHAVWPYDTQEFLELWGVVGEGNYLTLWVRNDAEQQHCALDFHGRAAWTHRWAQAEHTGTFVGWRPFSPVGFTPKHWPGC